MKYVLYKDINSPVYFVSEQFEFFYYPDKTKVSAFQQKWLVKHFSDWSLPDYRCINLKTGEKTSCYVLYEKSLNFDLRDLEVRKQIDHYRQLGYNEETVADEFGMSTKTLQRRYPREKVKRYWGAVPQVASN